MRSGELAKAAGVTVRALRHYRSIGLLPEPPRTESDYCDYRMSDLFRLLRIKNLVSLGFSLERIKAMLEDMDNPNLAKDFEYLDALDQELVIQIEQLEEKRRTIALLKKEQVFADTPFECAEIALYHLDQNIPSDLLELERDALLVCAHLLDKDEKEKAFSALRSIKAEGQIDKYRDIDLEIYNMPEDASESKRDELAQRIVDLMMPLVTELGIDPTEPISPEDEALLDHFKQESMSGVQNDITRRVVDIFKVRLGVPEK